MSTETLHWHPASKKPDADVTVLLFVPKADSEPVWPGYWDGEAWVYADGAAPVRGVEAWADMPQGAR